MLKGKTGSSVLSNAREAGRQAAAQAKQGLDKIKIAFVYASCDYDLKAMLEGIEETMPGIPVVGNTSYTGVITPEGYIHGDDGFVGIMALEDDAMTVGAACRKKGACAREDGRIAARQAMEAAGRTDPPDYFYMAASPGEEEFYLKGITEVIGRVPFFGGSCADNTITGGWQLYSGAEVFPDGVVVVFFYSEKPVANYFTGAYRETKDMGIVTKMEGHRTIAEIDGVPALKKYAQWRGMDPESLKGGALLAGTVVSPLGVKDRLGDLTAIRHPMNGNDDYTINVGNKVAEGTAVIRMEATVDELVSSVEEGVRKLTQKAPAPLGALHLVHCGGRRAGIGDRIQEVYAGMKSAAGDLPFIAEFTFGEYGYEDDGNNTCGGLMLSFTGFAK
ncbi:MAG: FIST N-terminal domain-containing protein [Peptococcaceae bacterium]|nr:FIST N-terminal domain-containing protein [Peptococcaceae bacterium]